MPDTPGPLMLLDSAGLWFRAFHSVPEKITGPDGAPVNAVRGFCDMVAVLLEQYRPSGLIAALDEDWRPGWRVDLLPGYKAHRAAADGTEDAPAALAPQVDTILRVLRAAGITTAAAPGAEADDVLAALATGPRRVLVVTGDRDLFQLASASTTVVYIGAGMRRRREYTPAEVAERFALPVGPDASVYADFAVLVGDASDGLPGVAGIGATTAAALLTEYGDLDGLLAAAADPDSGLSARRRAALTGAAGYLSAARRVVRLGARPVTPRFVGDPRGRRAPVENRQWTELEESTGQSRSLGRLLEAVRVLELSS